MSINNFAVIENDEVVNIVVVDGVTWPFEGQVGVLIPSGIPVGIGWGYSNGSFIAPPAPPVQIPPVTPRQIRMALTRAGLRTTVEAAVAAGDQDLKDWYEYSNEFNRDNPLVDQMATAIGQTPAQIDALWELAAGL
jgi:hypothetical protein